MKTKPLFLLLALVALAGCTLDIDAPKTPTVAVSPSATASPTTDETWIARLATRTPTPSATLTLTGTATATATLAPSQTRPTLTATATATDSPTPTATATGTSTATVTATRTHTPTMTRTSTPTATASRTGTFTATPTWTPSPTREPTRTPTEAIADMAIPSATLRASATFTPFPTMTPNRTGTARAATAAAGPSPTRTPGGIYTLTPAPPTPTPFPSVTGQPGETAGEYYDPYAPAGTQEYVPVAPAGDSGSSGPALPEQNAVVVSYAGQVVPLLTLDGAFGAADPMARGEIFAVSSTGQVAAVGQDRWLYVNGAPMRVSPASIYGVPDNLSFGDLAWSPDGHRLAFRVDAANPHAQNAIDSGVWVYEPGTNRSWQVFRTGFEGQVAQLHEQRAALSMQWAPNGSALLIKVGTPLGFANVFLPMQHDANVFVDSIPYADATWAPDSASLIVSGVQWNALTVVGRVRLDESWSYTEYLNQASTGLYMQAAIQLYDGRIAFLGSASPGSFALYTAAAAPGAAPVRVSAPTSGQVVAAEWNAARTAALVTVQTASGGRLWIVRTDGSAQDVTPGAGSPASAHWR